MNPDWINALIGGVLIGIAVSLMLFLNGRVTGISGIIGGALKPTVGDFLWRFLFLIGLFAGGLVMKFNNPEVFPKASGSSLSITIIAGLLVGFGTLLGSGCTSGHGVCGISRMSIRSLLATVLFITAGVISVFIFKKLGVY